MSNKTLNRISILIHTFMILISIASIVAMLTLINLSNKSELLYMVYSKSTTIIIYMISCIFVLIFNYNAMKNNLKNNIYRKINSFYILFIISSILTSYLFIKYAKRIDPDIFLFLAMIGISYFINKKINFSLENKL